MYFIILVEEIWNLAPGTNNLVPRRCAVYVIVLQPPGNDIISAARELEIRNYARMDHERPIDCSSVHRLRTTATAPA